MNPYEMVVLYHPDLEIDLDKPIKKVETILKNQKGKITNQDNWGKRKLAYPIKGEDHAIYVYYDIELKPETLGKVENNLNITDEVLRYLIVKPGPEIEEDEDEPEPGKEANDDKKESKTPPSTSSAKSGGGKKDEE